MPSKGTLVLRNSICAFHLHYILYSYRKSLISFHYCIHKPTISKKDATYLQRLYDFKDELSNLFDIKCTNKERLSNQTYLWGVMMEKDDFAFCCSATSNICSFKHFNF